MVLVDALERVQPVRLLPRAEPREKVAVVVEQPLDDVLVALVATLAGLQALSQVLGDSDARTAHE